MLKKEGRKVTATVDGATAWEALQQPDAPALAILDRMMPEVDGLEVVRRVRTLQTDLPLYIIMLTSKGEKLTSLPALTPALTTTWPSSSTSASYVPESRSPLIEELSLAERYGHCLLSGCAT